MSKLVVNKVTKRFGGLLALHDVSLETEREILGLIGPNGAGKTTLFNVISGFLTPTEGEVHYNGQSIHRYWPHQIVELGIARTFQIVKPFGDLTVMDNILSGYGMPLYPNWHAFFKRYRTPATGQVAEDILKLTGLIPWRDLPASSLPIGLQRRLEIARALATEPELLLLDEPAAGLTAQESEDLAELIRTLYDRGRSIIVIEHNMVFAMSLCQRVIVLAQGELIAQGVPADIQSNQEVINVYLGQQ
jgi:branched-chain amino acid transport system ATP-binding protein